MQPASTGKVFGENTGAPGEDDFPETVRPDLAGGNGRAATFAQGQE